MHFISAQASHAPIIYGFLSSAHFFSLLLFSNAHIYNLNMHEGRSIVQLKCNLSYALSPTIRHCIKWPTKSMVCVNTRIEKIYNYSHPYATTVHSNVDAPNSIQSQNYHNAIAWVVTIPLNKCRVFFPLSLKLPSGASYLMHKKK